MPDAPVARPWRRFLRFSVRGLIVAVLLIGVWLGWIVRNARIQREAVAAVESAGGIVFYDLELTKGELILGGKPWMPLWLVGFIGLDYLVGVTEVDLNPMPHYIVLQRRRYRTPYGDDKALRSQYQWHQSLGRRVGAPKRVDQPLQA